VVAALDGRGLDLMEFSGGTYFPGAPASSDAISSGPYFIDFAKMARQLTTVPLMATGGFKSRMQADAAIRSGATDLIGLARALVLDPALPTTWRTQGHDPLFPRFAEALPGGVTAWYTQRLQAIALADGSKTDVSLADAVNALADRTERQKQSLSKRLAQQATFP